MEDPTSPISRVLHGDILYTNILSFLEWKEALKMKQVASSWREAVAETPVEEQILVRGQNMLQNLGKYLPQLKSLKLDQSSELVLLNENRLLLHRFRDIHHFQCLHTTPSLLQSYPLQDLMNQWQNIQSLNLHGNEDLEWNLSDLTALQQLRDLRCINNRLLQGNTKDLLSRRDRHGNTSRSRFFYTLELLDVSGCTQVTGRLSDFAKLPTLQWLGINRTLIRGDLRYDVQPGDFASLQGMGLCSHAVYGASQIMSIQDAPAVMKARLQIMKQSTWDSPLYPLMLHLSPESPDYHERIEQQLYTSERDPPFSIEVVVAGKRWGWRWSNYLGGFCEVQWVDPEPMADEYQEYLQEMIDLHADLSVFSGFVDPPTPEQYQELCQTGFS